MIAIGCDHGGYALKQEVMRHLDELGLAYKDFGTYSEESCDYPIYGEAVARAVAGGECERGILICGTGIGISISANKVKGIRAAPVRGLLLGRDDPPPQRREHPRHGRARARHGPRAQDRGHLPDHGL